MKNTNRILGFFLNAAVMVVVVLIIKYQDDARLEVQKYNYAVYSSLMRTNTLIADNRTAKILELKDMVQAAQTAISTSTPSTAVNVKKTPSSAIKLPAPNPVYTLPIKTNRTTKTS